MESKLSKLLRESRLTAGISRTEAARRCGVSRMTLYRWERNQNVPRDFELRAALQAYGVGPARRDEMDSLREQSSGRALAIGAIPTALRVSRGDLLRALRGRAGLTQAELAARAAVPRARLNNWENHLSWPDDATTHRVAYALEVTGEELFALTAAPARRPAEDDNSLDYLSDRVSAFLALPDLTTCEMEIHSIMARLRAFVPRSPYARYELWYLEYGYALSLTLATRFREGIRWLKRAEANALPVRTAYEAAWPAQARGIIERITLRRAPAHRRRRAGQRQWERQNDLLQWRSHFSPAWEAANGMEMALALHLRGDDASALELAQSAFAAAASREEAQPEARLHRYGELLAATGRHDIILDIFPHYLGRNTSSDAHLFYYLGIAAHAFGDYSNTNDLLGKALIAARLHGGRLLESDILSAQHSLA